MQEEFNNKSRITNESIAQEKEQRLADMRRELENLENNRAQLDRTIDYTIGGTIEQEGHEQIEAAREARVNELRAALDNSNGNSKSK